MENITIKRYPRDVKHGEQIRVRVFSTGRRIRYQWWTVRATEREGRDYIFALLAADGNAGGPNIRVAPNTKLVVR